MKPVGTRFVPRFLSHEQRNFGTGVAQNLLCTFNNGPYFLMTVITGEGSSTYAHDPSI